MTRLFKNIDWLLLVLIAPLVIAGLLQMKSFGAGEDYFFLRQIVWVGLGFGIFVFMANFDWRFLQSSGLLLVFYILGVVSLGALILLNISVRGATSWFDFSLFSLEPSEPMKIVLILLLAKYFSRRHIEIANVAHIIISGLYFLLPAFLIFLQPDLGSVIVLGFIWFGLVMVSGISKKHLAIIFILGAIILVVAWQFVLEDYQKLRILTFINPYIDPQGAGYNALQAKIAVGSGGLWGKGIGFGSQSRLRFLPEHETDFIFAAFAEEWGLAGVVFLLTFFSLIVWRILGIAFLELGNFERFFAIGVSLLIMGHFLVHVGMNMAVLPITGIPLPFVSYGGSHIVSLFVALGIWSSMASQSK